MRGHNYFVHTISSLVDGASDPPRFRPMCRGGLVTAFINAATTQWSIELGNLVRSLIDHLGEGEVIPTVPGCPRETPHPEGGQRVQSLPRVPPDGVIGSSESDSNAGLEVANLGWPSSRQTGRYVPGLDTSYMSSHVL